jgi:hypothetical protein
MEDKRAKLKRLQEEKKQLEDEINAEETCMNTNTDLAFMATYSGLMAKFFKDCVKKVTVSGSFDFKAKDIPSTIFCIELEVPTRIVVCENEPFSKVWSIKCVWNKEMQRVHLILSSVQEKTGSYKRTLREFHFFTGNEFERWNDNEDDDNGFEETEVFGQLFSVSRWYHMDILTNFIFLYIRSYLSNRTNICNGQMTRDLTWLDCVQRRLA